MKKNSNKILEDVTKAQTKFKLKQHDKNFIQINEFTNTIMKKTDLLYNFINYKHIKETKNYFKPNEDLVKQYIDEELQLHTKKVIWKYYQIIQKEVKSC